VEAVDDLRNEARHLQLVENFFLGLIVVEDLVELEILLRLVVGLVDRDSVVVHVELEMRGQVAGLLFLLEQRTDPDCHSDV